MIAAFFFIVYGVLLVYAAFDYEENFMPDICILSLIIGSYFLIYGVLLLWVRS